MAIDLLFDRLSEVSKRLLGEVTERWPHLSFPEAAEFAVVRVARDPTHDSKYLCSVLLEMSSGLKMPLFCDLEDGDLATLDVVDLTEATLLTIGGLEDVRVSEVHDTLLNAIVDTLESNGPAGPSIRLVSLDARPVMIGEEAVAIGFEASLRMLGADLEPRTFVMRIKDADDFRQCFFAEILPEQRSRAAGLAGYVVPEAVND